MTEHTIAKLLETAHELQRQVRVLESDLLVSTLRYQLDTWERIDTLTQEIALIVERLSKAE